MELEDIRKLWKETQFRNDLSEADEQAQILNIIKRSKKGIFSMLILETLLTTIIYALFFIAVFYGSSELSSYHYKLTLIIGLFALPIYYRMFKSVSFLTNIDYGQEIRTNLTKFLIYYKTTLQFYQWGVYITIGLLFIFFFTDTSFLDTSYQRKVIIVTYLIFVATISGPLVKWIYRGKIKDIESFLSV